jgi:hypothetical protein
VAYDEREWHMLRTGNDRLFGFDEWEEDCFDTRQMSAMARLRQLPGGLRRAQSLPSNLTFLA